MSFRTLSTLSAIGTVSLLVACGSASSGSDFGDGTGNGTGTGDGTDGGASTTITFTGSIDGGSTTGTDPKCASAAQAAQLAPVNLVFAYDRSGSMGDGTGGVDINGNANPGVYACAGGDVWCANGNGYPGTVCAKAADWQASKVKLSATGAKLNTTVCPPGKLKAGGDAFLCASPLGCAMTSGFDPDKKWFPVAGALEAFFGDVKSTGMRASLTLFSSNDVNNVCSINGYNTAAVPLTDLPNQTPFKAKIDASIPDGGTPTRYALDGAYAQARAVTATGQTVVVLVTDGEPNGCGGLSDLAHTKQVVAAAAAGTGGKAVTTYVIGVGDSLANLQQIADAAGTGTSLTLVAVGNAAKTTDDIIKALEKIRGQTLSCDVDLPPPPAGKTLDINAVNVVLTSNGAEATLTYSKGCADPNGWQYDDPNAPKKVKLCANACNTARADAKGKLAITFGCATQGGVIR